MMILRGQDTFFNDFGYFFYPKRVTALYSYYQTIGKFLFIILLAAYIYIYIYIYIAKIRANQRLA